MAGLLSVGVVAAAAAGATHVFSTGKAAAAVNMNCSLIVPANPLSAQGLATPYQLTATNPANGPCNEANANQTAFVQGAVIDPATGQISVYNPLVIDQGTQPAAAPVVPTLPAGAVVAVWFGFNGTTLTLVGADQAGGGAGAQAAAAAAQGGAAAQGAGGAQGAAGSQGGAAQQAQGAAGSQAVGGAVGAAGAQAVGGAQGATTPAASNPPAAPSAPATATSTAATSNTGTSTTGQPGTATAPNVTGTAPPANANIAAASGTPDAVLQQSNCVAGESIQGTFSSFTQVGSCNAVAFFQAANAAIQAGTLTVPSPGTAKDGQPCLTTRNFGVIDQDQSDNVTTKYLASNGRTAQDTAANQQAMGAANVMNNLVLFNGSDNALIDDFVDPALGCTPWMAPDLANGGTPATALPLDELQAAAFAGQSGGPAALVPLNDPMTLDNNGNSSTDKTNTYRAIMDQPALPAGETPAEYCGDMESIQGVRLQQDVNLLIGQASPLPAASNLFTFLGMRLQQSFTNLNCGNFGLQNDVSTTVDGNGVVVAACFLQQVNAVTPGAGNPTAGMKVCPATTASASATATPTATAATPTASPTATGAATPVASATSPSGANPAGGATAGTPATTPGSAQTGPASTTTSPASTGANPVGAATAPTG
ncbi:MAG TPA: hypothetical protein VF070_48570 [Streptosporangiaceae bacterium]